MIKVKQNRRVMLTTEGSKKHRCEETNFVIKERLPDLFTIEVSSGEVGEAVHWNAHLREDEMIMLGKELIMAGVALRNGRLDEYLD